MFLFGICSPIMFLIFLTASRMLLDTIFQLVIGGGDCWVIPLWGEAVVQFGSGQSFCCVQLLVTPWTAAHQTSLSITNSHSLLKLMVIQSVMPSNYLILCRPLLLPPSFFPSIKVFSDDSFLHIRWPECWSFSFNISPSSGYSGLNSFRMDWLYLLAA